MQQKRSLRINVFDYFRKAMLNYFSHYSDSDDEKKKKSTTSHRIALELMKQFPSSCRVEIDYMGADIVIKQKDDVVLILLWSNAYLTEKEKTKAKTLHEEKAPLLTLAFSLLEDKNYLLVYRFERDFLEYLHIDKFDFSERVLKRSEEKDKETDQLLLGLKGKAKGQRKKRVKKEVEVKEEG